MARQRIMGSAKLLVFTVAFPGLCRGSGPAGVQAGLGGGLGYNIICKKTPCQLLNLCYKSGSLLTGKAWGLGNWMLWQVSNGRGRFGKSMDAF